MQTADQCDTVTPALILHNVCKYYGVDEQTLKGPHRSRNISEPRQLAMYLLRQMLGMTPEQIAKVFDRERTTVLHALRQVEGALRAKDHKITTIYQELTDNINAS